MKIDVGLIGKGKWGSKIRLNLIKFTNLNFVCGKKDNYLEQVKKYKIKWVFIATPIETHYEIVKNCLNNRINVFCEKPLCTSSTKIKNLIKISKKKKVKLYVSDLYDFYSKKVDNSRMINSVYRSKFVKGGDSEFFYRFLYHDISIFYNFLKRKKINKYIFTEIKNKKTSKLIFKLNKNKEINFKYNLNTFKKHLINNKKVSSKKDYLHKMIYNVVYNKLNITKNNKKAIFIVKLIEKIKKQIKYEH
jgi:hypothetical protein